MEKSPFDNNTTIALYLEPMLDNHNKTYVNILTCNTIPEGPIASMVRQMKTPKLSPFQTITNNHYPNCMYILTRYTSRTTNNPINWMTSDDIPAVFSYLQSNGYTIDTSLTKLTAKLPIESNSGNRKLVCMFTYNQKPEPGTGQNK